MKATISFMMTLLNLQSTQLNDDVAVRSCTAYDMETLFRTEPQPSLLGLRLSSFPRTRMDPLSCRSCL